MGFKQPASSQNQREVIFGILGMNTIAKSNLPENGRLAHSKCSVFNFPLYFDTSSIVISRGEVKTHRLQHYSTLWAPL